MTPLRRLGLSSAALTTLAAELRGGIRSLPGSEQRRSRPAGVFAARAAGYSDPPVWSRTEQITESLPKSICGQVDTGGRGNHVVVCAGYLALRSLDGVREAGEAAVPYAGRVSQRG